MFAAVRRFVARCLPSTSATRAAAVTFLMLVLMVLIAWAILFLVRRDQVDWEHFRRNMPLILGLLMLAPLIVYLLVSRWGELIHWSPYPDIDAAWKQGMDALEQAGLSLGSVPIFLLVGSTGGQLEQAIVQALKAAGVNSKVESVDGGHGIDHALRWYVTHDAIYLFCSDVGAISSVARAWSDVDVSAEPNEALPTGYPDTRTLRPPAARPFTETLMPGDIEEFTLPTGPNEPPSSEESVANLPSDINVHKSARRLQYLCELLKRKRRQLCGINGVVVLLPYELIGANGGDVQTLTEAIKQDLSTVVQTLQLRFPVTALLVGAQKAKGFGRFVRMLDPSQLVQRLGKHFETRQLPTTDRLQMLSVEICNAFEDWLYFLFGRPQSLEQSEENVKLYGLLCRVRQRLKPQLNNVLGKGFSLDKDDTRSPFFSGCYLSATGSTHEQQAFIKGIHDKLIREQSNVEWMRSALVADVVYRILTWAGWAVLAVTVVCLIVVILKS